MKLSDYIKKILDETPSEFVSFDIPIYMMDGIIYAVEGPNNGFYSRIKFTIKKKSKGKQKKDV